MKSIDLLKYLDKADPAYIEEASDYNLLLYRKGRKRTRTALAACLILVALAGVFLTKPALYAWETRNTVTSWPSASISFPGVAQKPSSPLFVSAEMPDRKRFSADTPFTLSIGLGQVSDYEYATLSVKAYGFEITDKDGNTVTDRYVRTFSDFNSGDYGVTHNDRHKVTGCTYLEDFTFRFVGNTKSTGSYPITLSLQSRDESSTMGDSVTVWYTLQNGVLKLSDKNPVKGDQNGNGTMLQPEELEPGLHKQDFSVQAALDPSVLYPGMVCADNFHLRVFHIPTQQSYSNDQFTAELIYAETLRKEDFSFPIMNPAYEKPEGSTSSWIPPYYLTSVPEDAPIGAYDLRVTDLETGFVWVFENMAWVLPKPDTTDPDSGAFPPYEDLSCAVTTDKYTFLQGESILNAFAITLVQYGEDVSFFCSAELVFAEDGGEAYAITVQDSPFSSHLPASYIPVDAPVGGYDLIVTDQRYGYTWRFNHIVEIIANPDAPTFGLNTNIERKLTISRTSEVVYTFVAEVENLGMPITMTVTPQTEPCPAATLTFAEAPAYGGELFEIPLVSVSTPDYDPYEWTWQTGATVTRIFEIMVTPDTPCGLYDLTLTYEDCIVIFRDAVEVVP